MTADDSGGAAPTVDIVCSAHNAGRFLGDFVAGLHGQTHRAWRLWCRDDGSTDDTAAVLHAAAAADSRIRVLHSGAPSLKATAAYSWLFQRVPADARWVMEADADDVWLPFKIERTLEVMRAEEARSAPGTPILVHTDLKVVDANLKPLHPSFWQFMDLRPEPVTLRRLIVRNITTSPTCMMNRALVDKVGAFPEGALYVDWWFTLVATLFGRVVAIHEQPILYRRHDSNIGTIESGSVPLAALPAAAARAVASRSELQAWMAVTALQARALIDRYGNELSNGDREFLVRFAALPSHGLIRRKLEVARLMLLPERGVLRNLSVLLRS